MPEAAFGQVMDSAALLLGCFALPLLPGLCPCPTGEGFLPSHTLQGVGEMRAFSSSCVLLEGMKFRKVVRRGKE